MHALPDTDPALPDPSDDDLRAIEAEGGEPDDFSDLDADLARALDAKRSHIPLKGRKRDRPFGIQRLDSLYKDPANWEPWSNITLVHRAEVDTVLGFFVAFRHREVLGARKLVRGPHDPLLGVEIEYVTDPWYRDGMPKPPTAERSTELHFPVSLRIILDDGLASEGEHVVHVGAVRAVGIRRAVLDAAVRLSHAGTILYLPAGLDLLDGLSLDSKLKLKEAFDAQA